MPSHEDLDEEERDQYCYEQELQREKYERKKEYFREYMKRHKIDNIEFAESQRRSKYKSTNQKLICRLCDERMKMNVFYEHFKMVHNEEWEEHRHIKYSRKFAQIIPEQECEISALETSEQ